MKIYPLIDYLTFTRAERIAVITLLCILIACYLFPILYGKMIPPKEAINFEEFHALISNLNTSSETESEKTHFQTRGAEAYYQKEEFLFNPNTAAKEEFLRLGLSDRVAQSILNYRNKGGTFRKKEDLSKIYTLRKEDYQRLEPWINLPEKTLESKYGNAENRKNPFPETEFKTTSANANESSYKTYGAPITIDVNSATAEDWIKLKGIGPAYAKRIVNYREKLGGFSSTLQIGETYGLPDSTFQSILPHLIPSSVYKKINVNTASLEDFKAHPYISNFQATVLINYRQQHGNLQNMGDFRKILVFKENDWARLEAYLSFD